MAAAFNIDLGDFSYAPARAKARAEPVWWPEHDYPKLNQRRQPLFEERAEALKVPTARGAVGKAPEEAQKASVRGRSADGG